MSDADIKANIGVSTDVEQATRKTSNSVVSMAKQMEDVGKKFSTAGKDIFLGFFAPMAILQTVMSSVGDLLSKAKQDAKDGLELLAKGETIYASDEEKKAANFFRAKKRREEEQESVMKGQAELAKQFMDTAEGTKLAFEFANKKGITDPEGQQLYFRMLAHDKEFQKKALEAFLASPEGKAYQPIFEGKKDFKGPEGFSNVVGVGANPVIEAMNAQLEEAQKQTALLQEIASKGPVSPTDFTKDNK